MDDAAIRLDGVTKVFDNGVVAVDDVSLTVREGEFFSLLGPSGCGKTTTLRLVAGFEEPTRGTLAIRGRDVTHVPPHKRDTGMVFQSYALFPHRTVFENVAFGLRMRRVPREALARRVAAALRLVELAGLGDSNLLDARAERVEGERAHLVTPDGARLVVPGAGLAAGEPVTLAVRPEKVRLPPDGGAVAAENLFAGTVESVNFQGDATLYRIALPSGRFLLALVPNDGSKPIQAPGAAVRLGWDRGDGVVLKD